VCTLARNEEKIILLLGRTNLLDDVPDSPQEHQPDASSTGSTDDSLGIPAILVNILLVGMPKLEDTKQWSPQMRRKTSLYGRHTALSNSQTC
jgi:hypothetical protein